MENNNDNMGIFSDVPMVEDTEGIFSPEQEIEEDNLIETEEGKDPPTNEETNEQPEVAENVVGTDDETEENNDLSEGDVNDSPSLFSSLTALLKDKGLISSELSEDKDIDEDTFVDLFKKEIKNNEYSDLTEDQKNYLQSLRDGVPEEIVKKEIVQTKQLESITEEMINSDENLRQRIIYNDFINRGFSEEKAMKYLNRSIELKADTEDAVEALASIKEFTKSKFESEKDQIKQAKIAEEQKESQRIENVKKKIKTTNEIIKDYKISDTVKEQVEKNMFEIVSTSPDGKQENSLMKYARENKEDFDLKLYYLYTITKGFQDFDVIEKSKNSKVVSDLERAMRTNTRIKGNGEPTYLQDPDSYGIDIAGHDIVTDY